MAVRFGRRVPNWVLLAVGSVVFAAALGVFALNRPLPEYLIASVNLKPGAIITAQDLKPANLDLGPAGESYLLASELQPGTSVLRVVRKGELLSRADLTFETESGLTSLRFTPKLKPANQVVPGSRVSVWRVLEVETGRQVQQLVAQAEVLDLVYGDGLFAQEFPEVEIRVSWEESALLLEAVSAESDIYLLPLS